MLLITTGNNFLLPVIFFFEDIIMLKAENGIADNIKLGGKSNSIFVSK